ncbi:uroporphyrin-III methyltransferase [Stygiolobus caldivivus]|uniref:Uroporphyrin-III methyltransferase n=2 Tax=Stygiolobus caldivivus TaxID=2824673 RepID=A0A8D5ZJ45_9CREN|nr:uroporphyrin-III methyltransferase [Stygiolobus caldivivus]
MKRGLKLMIKVKRVYDPVEKGDGVRILVDRLWPRGIKKDKVDVWLKDIAPSEELRTWFGHDPDKWEEFKRRYFEELSKNPKLDILLQLIKKGEDVTLLYASKSPYNNAVALKEFIDKILNRDDE